MKILICLNQDVHCLAALNYLLPTLQNHQIKIHFSNGVGKKPELKFLQEWQNIEADLLVENIKFIAKKADVKIDWESFLSFDEIKKNYQILDFKNINQDGLEYLSKAWKVDLIVSIRFGKIFKEPIIAVPRFGIVNLHSGILPDYRGILATFWAMKNKEKEIGATLHFVADASIDTGDIIGVNRIKADYKKAELFNIFRLYQGGVLLIEDLIQRLEDGLPIVAVKQDKNSGKYFSYPKEEDLKF